MNRFALLTAIPLCLPCVGQRAAASGQLVALAAEGLGWKKSTTYTVLKKLCERGVLQTPMAA